MLEDEFHDVEIRSGKPLEQFSELQHLDGTIVDHWKNNYPCLACFKPMAPLRCWDTPYLDKLWYLKEKT